MNTIHSIVTPARLRLYLSLLQGMFLVVYSSHLVPPMSLQQAGSGFLLATLTLLLLTLPRTLVETAWFISLLTLSNMGILVATFGISTKLWVLGTVVLLLAMASYTPSIVHFTVLSSLIIGGYGFALHHANLLSAEDVLILPLLFSITFVFVSKATTARAEIQRIVGMTDQPQPRMAGDAL